MINLTPKSAKMAITAETIDHNTLTHLVAAGAVRGADVIGHAGGWGVVIKYGMTERTLAARRGTIRTFRRFETLATYLKGVGISQYNVNAADFDLAIKKVRTRPDSAARMKAAFESESYTAWFKEKVAKSLADPRPSIPHDEVMADMQALIKQKRAEFDAKKAAA
jgi:GH25 family lysozyme M1 (1,4-beta-N-acetylmuramidase)